MEDLERVAKLEAQHQELRDLPDAEGWPNVDIPGSPSDQFISGNGD
jgi:hypothetical protein